MNKEKVLGKIANIELSSKDSRFGLWIELQTQTGSVIDNITCWDPEYVKITKHTKWTESDRAKELSNIMYKLAKLLKEAKVNNLTSLINTPIEAIFEINTLVSWRILTEVI